jgi:hypothetical protein
LSVAIYETPHNARRAYRQTLQAVKTGRPRLDGAKIVKIFHSVKNSNNIYRQWLMVGPMSELTLRGRLAAGVSG